MGLYDSEILTIEEAAEYLRIPVSTVYRLAQSGRIPAQKVGRRWRFYRPTLTNWIASSKIYMESKVDDQQTLDFS